MPASQQEQQPGDQQGQSLKHADQCDERHVTRHALDAVGHEHLREDVAQHAQHRHDGR